MSRHGKGGPVPNRWMNCPRKASELIIDKFMAFKTPLSADYDDQILPKDRFYPQMLFDVCRPKKIKFGIWIDLTNTTRFYNKNIVDQNICKYVKMPCRGHGETPTQEQTDEFINLVHNFITQHPLECIAVHCTHGFNRTGFLIVSYIVSKLDCSLEIALRMFAGVRPPGIYKGDYIKELYRRYADEDDAPPPPALPDWCFDGETDSSAGFCMLPNIGSSEASSGSSRPQNHKRRGQKEAVFMSGVSGVYEFTEQPKAHELKRKVQQMCEWKSRDFPGSQPVSMDTNNISCLHTKPYRVSWKADGTRYMMLIDGENETYFFDRDYNIFHVDGLTFPYRKDIRYHLKNTLIDGEMVIDKVNGQNIPRYLAYDVIKFQGEDVAKEPFYPFRLQVIDIEIIKPRYAAMEAGKINKASEPFSIRSKQFWHITQTANLLGEKFAATLAHEPDGLIFQPSNEPYVGGACQDVLKWKPPNLNSVDFRLKIVKQEGEGIIACKVGELYVGQLDRPFDKMKYTKALKDLDGKIIECMYDGSKWKFMRIRTDKTFPNSYSTAKAVCNSIFNPVTQEMLLDYIERYRFNDDSDLMPPPTKKIRRS